ncbi:cysteine desulfurase family protein [Thiorhodococcus mannitoliphagus]|uniref:cysteine desulfurase family protein n=1 Tax=Thiorhodococcus mannitoliphagus TaxID=329406 RepID=UPI001F0FF6BF|nr:cysteine desulfurase family protein [Thiorhodococcus mannitoliphagus]
MDAKSLPLYLDTAATTRIAPEVLAAMVEQLENPRTFANPSSSAHAQGQAAAAVVAGARAEVAAEFGCDPDEVIFTAGATEANNLALRGLALAHAEQGRHLITSRIEHHAVLACCESLERDGFEVSYLPPDRWGRIPPEAVEAAIRPDTLLISLMHTNNETGVLQPIEDVAALAAEHGVLLHVDAAQAAGKLRIRLDETPIDLLSISAHKFHGPKGIGCLIVRNRRQLRLRPLMYGGGQEFGLRPGTLPTHQIVGLSAALTLAASRRGCDLTHVAQLKRHFIQSLATRLKIQIHGHPEQASPYILNLSLDGIGSDALINQLAGVLAIASGSACSSGTIEPSHVLRSMGIEGADLYGAVRISFDRAHSLEDIATAVDNIVAAARRLQELS